jgi:DNA-binding response OmpR family regulator/anti-sigma regulatory factor (Ser/Thr protein kinase)
MKILAVDDDHGARKLLHAFLDKLGHETMLAENGEQAIELFESQSPDMVLMDLLMPGMDGVEVTERLRKLRPGVPIIMQTASTRADLVVRGLNTGADDYVTKPIDFRVLEAKINALARSLQLRRELEARNRALEEAQEEIVEQNQFGQHVMERLVDTPGLRDATLSFTVRPASQFSGDMVAAARNPAGALHVLLADAVGHGLAAALNVLPLVQTFYTMTAKGFGLSAIAREMNRKLKDIMPLGRFVAATLAVMDVQRGAMEVWNGGLPPLLLVDGRGRVRAQVASTHLALGILDDADFDAATSVHAIASGDRMVLFSDGLVEAANGEGVEFGLAGIEQALASAPAAQALERVTEALLKHLDTAAAHDDVSLLVIDPSREHGDIELWPALFEQVDAPVSTDWRFDLSLGPEQLSVIDVTPMAMHVLQQLPCLQPHLSTLFLVVSELYNNALEHGLLGLDSRLKGAEDGFNRYIEERARRLAALSSGRLDFQFELRSQGERKTLVITSRDSGPGFDTKASEDALSSNTAYHGRGIALMRRLCASLEYHDDGATAVATYVL